MHAPYERSDKLHASEEGIAAEDGRSEELKAKELADWYLTKTITGCQELV